VTASGALARIRAEIGAALRDRVLVAMADALEGAVALEPGGPSALFGRLGVSPVYSRLAALDTLDYAAKTLWSGANLIPVEPRAHLIGEAGHLEGVANASYDAVLASHVIEHLANPLGGLAQWQRVVRPGGHVLLVVPHRDGTFDHRRTPTTIEHMRADAARDTGEDDRTHLDEILERHDLGRDPGAPNREVFEQRCRENLSTRAMHHHVFVSRTVVELCEAAGLDVLMIRAVLPFNIVCLCRVGSGPAPTLSADELSRALRASPFASDRQPVVPPSDHLGDAILE
jgi:SAM-dependent methyltransferase